MGYWEYEPLAAKYRVPVVVTGFEPLDILQGMHMITAQLERGAAEVQNQYSRVVTREGNRPAQQLMNDVFRVVARNWRGIGEIKNSGLVLNNDYQVFDAGHRFGLSHHQVAEDTRCISGLVLQGRKKPPECAMFGTVCTPERPLGATMVSAEGACAAFYRYRPGGGDKSQVTKQEM